MKGDTWVILNSVLFGCCKPKSKGLATNMNTGWWLSHRVQVSILIPVCCPQPHPTLFDPMDCSPPGFSVHGILQARVLEWVAIPSSRGSSRPRNWTHVSWVSCIAAGRFFTHWATWEAPACMYTRAEKISNLLWIRTGLSLQEKKKTFK